MNDILLLGRVDSGKIEFKPVNTDVIPLIEELISQRQFVINDDRVIKLSVVGNPYPIPLDTSLFTHIISNLFSNALKYSKGKADPECTVSFMDAIVQITVVDYGIGISDDDLSKVFESFHRGKNAENIQGTGLGLQIVKQFVEMHSGKIEVTSKLGVGTKVAIDFPAFG